MRSIISNRQPGGQPEYPLPLELSDIHYEKSVAAPGIVRSGVDRHVTYKGAPLVKGKRVTGFTNEEEEEVHLTHVVPFLVEDELKRLGAHFEKVPNWQPFSIVDGRLITGQNPASSTSAAQTLLKVLAADKSRIEKAA